jgi:hypothetical protein
MRWVQIETIWKLSTWEMFQSLRYDVTKDLSKQHNEEGHNCTLSLTLLLLINHEQWDGKRQKGETDITFRLEHFRGRDSGADRRILFNGSWGK